jgi:hypothetical protein
MSDLMNEYTQLPLGTTLLICRNGYTYLEAAWPWEYNPATDAVYAVYQDDVEAEEEGDLACSA